MESCRQNRFAGKPTTRRYTDEEKAQAVRLVRQLRRELGSEHGTVQRVADQLGYGVETVRKWVKRADVDEGVKPGRSSEDTARIKTLEGDATLEWGHAQVEGLASDVERDVRAWGILDLVPLRFTSGEEAA